MVYAKLSSLTEAQWEHARAIRDEYIAATLCTDPADRPAAEAAIRRSYELAGLQAPRFIWSESPATAFLMARILDSASPERQAPKVGERLEGLFNRTFGHSLEVSMRRSLVGPLENVFTGKFPRWLPDFRQLARQLSTAAYEDALRRPLPEMVGEPLAEAVKGPRQIRWTVEVETHSWLRPARELSAWGLYGGQFDSRIADFDVSRRLGLVSYNDRDSERLDLLCALIRSCGLWLPYRGICLVTERPAVVRTEAPGALDLLRLHCPDGPAVVFGDGWSVYAWHGTRVPAALIENGWDAVEIMAEWNTEIRRCAIEKLGWNAFEQYLIPVASVPDPGNPGQVLTLCDLPGPIRDLYRGPVRLLLCSNGTPESDGTRRRFALQVSPHHTDPVAAAADLYGWTRREYAALARRA
jgi:hypothetical protein